MKQIAVRDLRPGMTIYVGSTLAKVSSVKTEDPPTVIAWGGQEAAPAIKLELTIVAHPSDTMIQT